MEMIQTYQGYFREDGLFVPDSVFVKIPPRRRAIVNILEDEMNEADVAVQGKTDHQQRVVAIKKVIEEANEAEDGGLTDNDWDELSNLRTGTNSGLSRVIDL